MVGHLCRFETRKEMCTAIATLRGSDGLWYCRKHFDLLVELGSLLPSSPPPAPSPSPSMKLRMVTFTSDSYGGIAEAFNEFFSKKPDVEFEHCEVHDQMLVEGGVEFSGFACVVVYYE